MPVSILSISLLLSLNFLSPDPQTPNYYPGLLSAREASKKSHKEMIIFFTGKTCKNCESAWMAFSNDAKATNRYISTRMNVNDFDGGIFFDLLDLEEVPSWIIMAPDGTEMERWEGGWKDASGQPTLFAEIVEEQKPVAVKQPIKSATPPSAPATASVKTTSAEKIEPKAEVKKTAAPAPTTVATTPVPASPSATSTSGYVIQAGYFGSDLNAKKMLSDLHAKGFASFGIKTEQKDGATFYRIISKPYSTESDAIATQQKLLTSGVKATVKPQF